jgi:hypothetical protein
MFRHPRDQEHMLPVLKFPFIYIIKMLKNRTQKLTRTSQHSISSQGHSMENRHFLCHVSRRQNLMLTKVVYVTFVLSFYTIHKIGQFFVKLGVHT